LKFGLLIGYSHENVNGKTSTRGKGTSEQGAKEQRHKGTKLKMIKSEKQKGLRNQKPETRNKKQ